MAARRKSTRAAATLANDLIVGGNGLVPLRCPEEGLSKGTSWLINQAACDLTAGVYNQATDQVRELPEQYTFSVLTTSLAPPPRRNCWQTGD